MMKVPISIRENMVSLFLRKLLVSEVAGRTLTDFSDIRIFHKKMLFYSNHDVLKEAKNLVFSNKYKLWEKLATIVDDRNLFVFEFGVFEGEGMRWWLKRKSDLSYVGFDTFEGLPDPWVRNGEVYLKRNHFSTQSKLPKGSSDARVTIYKGNIFDNESELQIELTKSGGGKRIFILDFDLMEPTKFVQNLIKESITEGDILFFDEGFDSSGELQLLENLLKEAGRWEIIGWTNLACAIVFNPLAQKNASNIASGL